MSAILRLMLVEAKHPRRPWRRSGQRRRSLTIVLVAILAGLVFVASSPASGQRPRLSLVALTPGNIRVHNGGELALGVVCHATRGRCQGRVVLAPARHGRNHTALATRTITLPAGRTTVVTVALTLLARRGLARHHRLAAAIVIRVRDHAHQLATLTATRVLVRGAPIGCWPRGAGSDPRWSWATARLFSYDPPGFSYSRAYGCLFRLDRAVQLLDPGARNSMFAALTDPRWDPVPFADPYVAGVIQGFGPQPIGEPFWDVASWDLRTGRRVHRDRLGTGAKQRLSLVMSATDGAIASIYGYSPEDPGDAGSATVYADDADGGHVLDSGSGIVVSSLRISGSIVSWTHDGQTRTAILR